MRMIVAIASLAAVLSTPAMAAKEEKKAADPKDVVCKRDIPTGTRFATRICHTREEWAEIEEVAKRDASALANRPMLNKSGD